MKRSNPRDPWALDAESVAWHQQHTFMSEPHTFAERIAESERFRTELTSDGWGVADWILPSDEAEPSPFPFGRVTFHREGILLEAFSEARLAALRRRATDLGAGVLTPDETRAFPLGTVLENPGILMQPQAAEPRSVRFVAETWLRCAWPFVAREELGGRAPWIVAGTARGHAALEQAIASLPDELARIPGFPRFTVATLRALLLPADPSATPTPEPRPRVRRAPGGS